MSSWRGTVIACLVLAASAGCYRPNVRDGGFLCPDGGACPEGFHCASDHRCYAGDGGPEVRMCTDALPVLTSFCNDGPIGGECNPACQNGCVCGGRCTVVVGASRCVSVGGKGAGDLCNLANDDCATGLGCVREGCGTNLGRCHQFCGPRACAFGTCNVAVGASKACDASPYACDPVAGTGCADSALACYIQYNQPTCDCAGTIAAGKDCIFPTDCLPGYECITIPPTTTCRKVCRGPSDCPAPLQCNTTIGGAFGVCTT